MGNGFFDNVPPVDPKSFGWPTEFSAAPDHTAEPGPGWTHEFAAYDEHQPRHEAPRRRRRLTAGVPWALAAAAVVVALVSATHPFGAAPMTFPSPSAQPAPKAAPAVTRTVRVTPPAVTVQAAPRPAETVYKTATVMVTRTAEPRPAATVTVTATKTVTAEPEQAPAVPGD